MGAYLYGILLFRPKYIFPVFSTASCESSNSYDCWSNNEFKLKSTVTLHCGVCLCFLSCSKALSHLRFIQKYWTNFMCGVSYYLSLYPFLYFHFQLYVLCYLLHICCSEVQWYLFVLLLCVVSGVFVISCAPSSPTLAISYFFQRSRPTNPVFFS